MKKILAVLLLGIGAAGAVLFWHYRSKDIVLSETPARLTARPTYGFASSSSSASLDVTIAYAAIADQLNALKIDPITKSDTGTLSKNLPGIRTDFPPVNIPGPRVSVGYRWTFTAKKNGPFSIGRAGDRLRVSLPIRFDGNAGFRGDIAHFMKLDKKNFDGAIVAHIDLSFDIDENWEPKIDAKVDFDWQNKARLEIVGGVWIPIADLLNDPLRDAMKKAGDEVKKIVRGDMIRKAVTPAWKVHRLPLGRFGDAEAVFVVQPKAAAFSGIKLGTHAIAFSARAQLEGVVEWPATGVTPPPLTLPKLGRTPIAPGNLNITLPFSASYESLRKTIETEIAHKTISGSTPLGQGQLTVSELSIYPTADGRIAIGAQITAKFDKRFFDVKGWIFLTAKPVLDVKSQSVALQDIRFSRALDNTLWQAVTALFESPIRSALESKAQIDLKPWIAETKTKLLTEFADPKRTAGIKVVLRPDFLGLRDLQMTPERLLVTVGFEGGATLLVDGAVPRS